MPFLGSIVAVAALGAAMRRKGVVGGAVDSTLDALPFVGLLKNAVEAVRGRDFVRDKAVARR